MLLDFSSPFEIETDALGKGVGGPYAKIDTFCIF